MRGTKPNISMISGLFEPRRTLIYGLSIYQNTSKNIRKSVGASLIYFHVYISGKDGHPEMMKIRLIKSLKSWIWDQHLSKDMKGFFLIWYQYPYQNTKWHFLEIWNVDRFGVIFLGPKKISLSQGIHEKTNFN